MCLKGDFLFLFFPRRLLNGFCLVQDSCVFMFLRCFKVVYLLAFLMVLSYFGLTIPVFSDVI